jgi:tRNA (guanine-N7-)-methyltransferase
VGKKKLVHFEENLTFNHLFQPKFHQLVEGFPLKGNWNSAFFKNSHPLVVELGCGKGEYTVGLSERYPDRNFIGIDWKGARLWRGCKTVEEKCIVNAAFVRTQIGQIERIFGQGEVSEIWITFPDPQPKKERARLTAPGFLEKYGSIMVPGGLVHLKTDDFPFYDYTLGCVRQGGYLLLDATDDLYSRQIPDDVSSIRTYYEQIWLEMGKKICYLKFQISAP